MTWLL